MISQSLELLPGFEVTLGFRKKNLKNFVRFALKVFQKATDNPSRRKPLTENGTTRVTSITQSLRVLIWFDRTKSKKAELPVWNRARIIKCGFQMRK